MKWIGIVLGIIVGAFLEITFFKVPFVLMVLLITLVFIQKPWVLFLSIPAGLLLDSLSFRLLGESSIFFAVMIGLFFTYAKKFEIQSVGFVVFASLLSSVCYLLIFGADAILFQVFFSVGFAFLLFMAISYLTTRFSRTPSYLDR